MSFKMRFRLFMGNKDGLDVWEFYGWFHYLHNAIEHAERYARQNPHLEFVIYDKQRRMDVWKWDRKSKKAKQISWKMEGF